VNINGTPPTRGSGPDWLQPRTETSSLERYLQVIRQRLWLIIACVVVCTGVAVAFVALSKPVYEAQADLLISPVSDADEYVGLQIIRQSSDPTRDVQTASRLVATPEIARAVKQKLDSPHSVRWLLDHVKAEPVAQSSIVTVVAQAGTRREAQQLANAFGDAIVADRTRSLHAQIDRILPSLDDQLKTLPGGSDENDRDQILFYRTQLSKLRSQPDPTIQFTTRAELPQSQISPRPVFTTVAGVFVGLVLGIAAAFALQMLDPRLRREEQLRELTRLPLLARVPKEGGRRKTPLRPERLSPNTIEAYRTLRATLAATRGGRTGPRSILVTGASAGEGKTTTAINLAASLALAGHSVILIEADLRRPTIGKTLGIEPEHDIMSVVLEQTSLEDALVRTDLYGENLELLLAKPPGEGGASFADGLFLPTAQTLISDAKRLADFVIIDSPPLTEVIDGLALAERADEVLLVVRLGRSPMARIQQLGELLARHNIDPVGFAVVGVPASQATSPYYSTPTYSRSGGKLLARR